MYCLLQPPGADYDWRFQIFGFPVRVSLWFWLVSLMMGSGRDLIGAVIWVAACFISILVHELGHAFMMRHYYDRPEIVLYAGGGLAIPSDWYPSKGADGILVPLAGPMAGFGAAVAGLVYLLHWKLRLGFYFLFLPVVHATSSHGSPYLGYFVGDLLFLNLCWGLFNLLPIWPLDGGHIARVIWERKNHRYGEQRSLILSIAVAALCAVAATAIGMKYLAVFFVFFGVGGLQLLDSHRSTSPTGADSTAPVVCSA